MCLQAVLGDWRVTLALPIFYLIDLILKSPLGRSLFDSVRQKETLRGALEAIYDCDQSVDDELVDMFYGPSCDEGAADVFISVYTGKSCDDKARRRGAMPLADWDDSRPHHPV